MRMPWHEQAEEHRGTHEADRAVGRGVRGGKSTRRAGRGIAGVRIDVIAVDEQGEHDDEDDRRDNRKMTKAERKNLRRQKELERRYGLSDE